MLIDSHCHIFTERIVENMNHRPVMVEELKLNVHDALPRLAPRALAEYAEANGIDLCVLLPTAAPHRVKAENDRFIEFAARFSRLRTLGTLHPMMKDVSGEIMRVFDFGINGFKFSSFSQRFDLLSPEAGIMFAQAELLGLNRGMQPVMVFDTFVRADFYFNADPNHLTTPFKLAQLVHRHPGINFIGAHMGGLMADFDDVRRDLVPASNLFLDTSNAAHTLTEEQFIELLRMHGSSHVLFGTDWPWFVHAAESRKVRSLMIAAGYSPSDRDAVFGLNANTLFGF